MTALTILSNEIRISDGFYSLNDLHKASGRAEKHQPSFFFRNTQTKELIKEIKRSANSQIAYKTVRGGKHQGTWVCKELVYSYAMWIDAKFNLYVIRAFENQQSTQPPKQLLVKPQDLSINDLIFELSKLRKESVQQTQEFYKKVFNGMSWMNQSGFEQAIAKKVLQQDFANEQRAQTPEVLELKECAKQYGLTLVNETELRAMQGRMQNQSQQIEKLITEMMSLNRNHGMLMNGVI